MTVAKEAVDHTKSMEKASKVKSNVKSCMGVNTKSKKKKLAEKASKGESHVDVKDKTKNDGAEKVCMKMSKEENHFDAKDKKENDSTGFCKSYTIQISGLPALYKKDHILALWKKSGLKEPADLLFPCNDASEELPNKDASTEASPVEEKDQRKSARFTVASKQQALKAYNVLSGKAIGKKKNYTLKAILNTPDDNFRAARKSRLILRNVSFQCSEDDLKKVFSNYGTVTEATIPLKPDGKKKGFAFVQFTHVFEAAKAIKAMNMQEIKGRKVAIDWSVPKNKYMEMNSAVSQEGSNEHKVKKETNPMEIKSEEKQVSKNDPTDTDDDSEEDVEDEDDSEENSESSNSEGEAADDETDDELSDAESEELPAEKPVALKKKHNPKTSHDVHEHRTVFVQNISFDTSEESFRESFKDYGNVSYAKIVMNHDTGMSKGCGFVQFKTTDEATECIKAVGEKSIMLDGKELRVLQAVSRNDAGRLKDKEKPKEKADKRNLYLGREGLVRAGTLAAEGLSQIELKKREKIEIAKRAKLRNPNVFFSTTRLCIHNLPRSVDGKKLKESLMSQFENRRGVRITECRIMRDMKTLNANGEGRPLGFAFVNFSKHEHALNALRRFNNNPDVFGALKRPIVEFSLENRKALDIKEQRKSKFLAKQRLKKEMAAAENDSHSKPSERPTEQSKTNFFTDKKRKKETEPRSTFQRNDHKRQRTIANPETIPISSEAKLHFQGSYGTTASGKKLPLPKHARPKIRTKNKGKILEQLRRSKKLNKRAPLRKNTMKNDGEGRKRKNDSAEKKDFADHVSKYARVLSKRVDQKWYE